MKRIIMILLITLLPLTIAQGTALAAENRMERQWIGTNDNGVVLCFNDEKLSSASGDGTVSYMPHVLILIALLGAGVIILFVVVYISRRTKSIVKQKQEYKEIAGYIMGVAAAMSDLKVECMAGHSRRVAEYADMIGRRLGMAEDELETLHYSALLHDIGEVGIPDHILNKRGPLTDEEYDIVKRHVTVGCELLDDITIMGDITTGVRYHHERVDGAGYTEGLRGDEIPLTAKIISVCNALDRMLTDQPYRKAMPVEKVQSEFVSNAGKQFDEKITAVLISLINEGVFQNANQYADKKTQGSP